jgi:superfamily II DNA helicase RecQ
MKVQAFQIRLSEEHLEGDIQFINEAIEFINVKRVMSEFVTGQIEKWSVLIFYEDQKAGATSSSANKIAYPKDAELTEIENEIFTALKEWRLDQANELGIPAYMVCSNAELVTVVKMKPETKEDILKLKGFGEHKTGKIGDDIIAILNSF